VLVFLALVFVVVPLVELYVLVQVGQAIGALETIALVVVVSLVGAWLARHEGFVVLQRVRDRLARGEVPANEMLDGLLVLVGGLLLLCPGFVTDAFGLVMLFPPTRALLRMWLRRRLAIQVSTGRLRGPRDPWDGGNDTIDI
jgi:UPF0716 protein FxsA